MAKESMSKAFVLAYFFIYRKHDIGYIRKFAYGLTKDIREYKEMWDDRFYFDTAFEKTFEEDFI